VVSVLKDVDNFDVEQNPESTPWIGSDTLLACETGSYSNRKILTSLLTAGMMLHHGVQGVVSAEIRMIVVIQNARYPATIVSILK
jgi:hypothetical protein